MRLLTSVDTLDAAAGLEQLMHASGIPVFVEPDYTRTAVDLLGGTFGYRIHLWQEDQIEDALRVMEQPDYQPPTAVDVPAFFAALEAKAEANRAAKAKNFNTQLKWLVGIIAAGLVARLAYSVISGGS
jgi:hypothetical protein